MILVIFGTRPEWIKVKPLIDKMINDQISFKTLFTGQHKDLVKESKPDYVHQFINNSNNNRLDAIIYNTLNAEDRFWEGINYIIVQGDTASAFGLALAAMHRKIKIIHLEAGLRTYSKENPFPEESYRQLISRIADIHLCPTKLNKKNLINENVAGEIYVTGNTVLDNIINIKPSYEDKILITLHRRENLDIIQQWFEVINAIAGKYKNINFMLPIHPNPEIIKYKDVLTNVDVYPPLSHNELIEYLKKTKLVITDSGGIQEEASFLNKKIIVCRKITERIELVGKQSFMCYSPEKLEKIFDNLIYNYKCRYKCPYGDGNASNKIINILNNLSIKSN